MRPPHNPYHLTDEQIEKFCSMYPTSTNEELANEFGMSKFKIRKTREALYNKGIVLNKTEEFMLQCFRANFAKGTAINKANNYAIQRKSMLKLHEEGKACKPQKGQASPWHTASEETKAQWRKVMSNKIRGAWEMERKRVSWGLEQKTNLRVQECNRPRASAKYYLINKLGYVFLSKWVFGITEDTQRRPRREQIYAEKFKFKFKEI